MTDTDVPTSSTKATSTADDTRYYADGTDFDTQAAAEVFARWKATRLARRIEVMRVTTVFVADPMER